MKLKGGEYWYHLVRLSVCPSVDRNASALYLQQYSSDPFHICTSYQATSEGVSRLMPVSKYKNLKFWRFFLICNFDFVFFWLGIQYDSMVWVIIRRRGVSSERRRSSCSSIEFSTDLFDAFLICDMLILMITHLHYLLPSPVTKFLALIDLSNNLYLLCVMCYFVSVR